MEKNDPNPPEQSPFDRERAEFDRDLAYRAQLINSPFARGSDHAQAELFDARFARLPALSAELARYAYTALAKHDNSELREVAAVCMDMLYAVDSERAMELWLQLLADTAQAVRFCALELVEQHLETGKIAAEDIDKLLDAAITVWEQRLLGGAAS